MARPTILLVDDNPSIRFSVRAFLEDGGFQVVDAASCQGALDAVATSPVDAAIVDYFLPDGTALDLLPKLKELPVLVLTAHGSVDIAVRAMKEGAEHFLTKPIELPALAMVLRRALAGRRALKRVEAHRARQARRPLDPFLGPSEAVRRLRADAWTVLTSPSPILISGPTGSGKGVLAAWFHENGPRADEAFVDLNCAGLAPAFLESDLFGHERGAFTGAVSAKPGLLETAHRGTLFLDEIGDVDPAVQPKLLKVLEERRFRRLGEVRDRAVDVRFIAATHQDLASLVRERRFRSDLYFRINTLPIAVPPLSARPEDIPDLARVILENVGADLALPELRLSPEALQALQRYGWPGNVRELRNALERAALFARDAVIGPGHLRLGESGSPLADAAPVEIVPLEENERRYLERVMSSVEGRVEIAARALGISRSGLYERLRRHGIKTARIRAVTPRGAGAH